MGVATAAAEEKNQVGKKPQHRGLDNLLNKTYQGGLLVNRTKLGVENLGGSNYNKK